MKVGGMESFGGCHKNVRLSTWEYSTAVFDVSSATTITTMKDEWKIVLTGVRDLNSGCIPVQDRRLKIFIAQLYLYSAHVKLYISLRSWTFKLQNLDLRL